MRTREYVEKGESEGKSLLDAMRDGSNEGIRSRHHPHFSVQFHPEASPGPQDTGFLFDDFLRRVVSVAQR